MITHSKTITIKIEIDEKKLKEKYPNFLINYLDINEFMDTVALGLDDDKMKELGYKTEVVDNI